MVLNDSGMGNISLHHTGSIRLPVYSQLKKCTVCYHIRLTKSKGQTFMFWEYWSYTYIWLCSWRYQLSVDVLPYVCTYEIFLKLYGRIKKRGANLLEFRWAISGQTMVVISTVLLYFKNLRILKYVRMYINQK